MKNTFRYLFLSMLLVGLISCSDDDKLFDLDDDFQKGSTPNFTPTANDDGFIDIFDLDNVTIEFSVDFTNNLVQSNDGKTQGSGRLDPNLDFADAQQLDIEVMWRDVSTGESYTGMLGSTTTWPASFTYSTSDIVAAIDELTSKDLLEVGDVVTISGGVHQGDGRVLPAFVQGANGFPTLAYSPSFFGQPGLLVALLYNVACGSDLASSTVYDVMTIVEATCCGLPTGEIDAGTTATVTQVGTGKYQISDFLNLYFTPFGGAEEAIVVSDVCNVITVDASTCPGSAFLCYIPNTADGAGSYDPATDTWVIKWEDAFGNGIRGVSTLTPL